MISFVYVGSTMPTSPANELGAEQWPQGIIILLVFALLLNIYQLFRRGQGGQLAESFRSLSGDTLRFFKSKLFIGMALVLLMSVLYEPIGFMVTSLVFLFAYGALLGERRWLRLALSSLIITALLYIGFAVFLGVMLPRGQVPFLRSFSLFVESIIPTF